MEPRVIRMQSMCSFVSLDLEVKGEGRLLGKTRGGELLRRLPQTGAK